jgi:chromosome segregation ATPase
MSSQLSDTSTVFGRTLNDSQLSSQLSDFLTGSRPDPLKPDNLQNALSSGWASYLNAQHTSREVAMLKRHIDEQVKQLSTSLTLMKRDFSDHQQLITAATAETKEISEQLGPLRDVLPLVQQDVRSNLEKLTNAIADMAERVGILQGKMEGTDMIVSADINSIRQQYDTALEVINSLRRELRELRAEKIAAEQKISALESQVGTVMARQELPEGAIELLSRLLLRQDGLVHTLERLGHEINPVEGPTESSVHHLSGEDGEALPCK